MVEAWKKLVLVGFAVLVSPGSVVQLASAFLFALVYMLLTSTASPFKNHGDDYFAQACSFGNPDPKPDLNPTEPEPNPNLNL